MQIRRKTWRERGGLFQERGGLFCVARPETEHSQIAPSRRHAGGFLHQTAIHDLGLGEFVLIGEGGGFFIGRGIGGRDLCVHRAGKKAKKENEGEIFHKSIVSVGQSGRQVGSTAKHHEKRAGTLVVRWRKTSMGVQAKYGANMAGPLFSFAYRYDALGRMVGITNPANETTQWGYIGSGGRVASQTLANGVTTLYAYDGQGRVHHSVT